MISLLLVSMLAFGQEVDGDTELYDRLIGPVEEPAEEAGISTLVSSTNPLGGWAPIGLALLGGGLVWAGRKKLFQKLATMAKSRGTGKTEPAEEEIKPGIEVLARTGLGGQNALLLVEVRSITGVHQMLVGSGTGAPALVANLTKEEEKEVAPPQVVIMPAPAPVERAPVASNRPVEEPRRERRRTQRSAQSDTRNQTHEETFAEELLRQIDRNDAPKPRGRKRVAAFKFDLPDDPPMPIIDLNDGREPSINRRSLAMAAAAGTPEPKAPVRPEPLAAPEEVENHIRRLTRNVGDPADRGRRVSSAKSLVNEVLQGRRGSSRVRRGSAG